MSIKFNNTEIPAKKGNIKFNGTELTEVKFNGTSIWKILTDPIYIIKEGVVQTGYTNPSCYYNGHTARSGTITLVGDYIYGLYAHTIGSSSPWYVATSNINTNGASTLEIGTQLYISGSGVNHNLYISIYSGSTLIEKRTRTTASQVENFTDAFNISGYSSISIILASESIGSSTNAWVGIGIKNAILK